MDRKYISVILSPELDQKLQEEAQKQYTTKSSVLRRLVSKLGQNDNWKTQGKDQGITRHESKQDTGRAWDFQYWWRN